MSAFAADLVPAAQARGFIRPIDVRRDLPAIADLVELCFSDTLDPDGFSYLKQMRAAARASFLFDSLLAPYESVSNLPVTGFVWEVEGRLVGNLSLITIQRQKPRPYLIANVAVHPDFRNRGIARQLTATALGHLQRQCVPAAWLHVREDNPPAVHLYQSLGFQQRTRRTTWNNLSELSVPLPSSDLQITPRQAVDWRQQRQWLSEIYPADYSWHLDMDWQALGTGWWSGLYRFFTLTFPRHWMARQAGQLVGSLSWLHSDHYSDSLFLGVPQDGHPQVVLALLSQARHDLSRRKHLTLNTPADLAPSAIQQAGFYAQQTLLWMEIKLG